MPRLVPSGPAESDMVQWFASGFTYSGPPVSCAVAPKTIDSVEPADLLGNVRRVGLYLAQGMAEMMDLHLVGDVHGGVRLA
ncbi:hypothetical protein [Pseudorhodobacter ferrugineus]|uniref:hypothetical protein n=1 Tax=Pseudorhodobacter ferrugineus TaxID=77008 RepID=UPI0003FC06ED|nr:hypothetical protein [Pseudorhodobacter ferrugineus]